MIGTLDIKVNAANPNMPLAPFYTFVGSPSQVRVINVPKAIGKWSVTGVQVTVNYPDNASRSVNATLVGGCWSATIPASASVGQSLMGFKITASGTDESGASVTGYVLGKGDAFVLDDDSTITVGSTTYYAHLVDTTPATPKKGDLCVIDGVWKIYTGTAWSALGSTAEIAWSAVTNKPAWVSPATEGTAGQVLTKTADGSTWATPTGGSVAWNDVTGKPEWIGPNKPTYTAAEVGADVSGAAATAKSEAIAACDPVGSAATAKAEAIAASDPVGSAISAVTAHVNTGDPHPGKYDASGSAATAKAEAIAACDAAGSATSAVSAHDLSASAHSSLFGAKQQKITANGILKGDGTGAVTAAVAGTDYLTTHQDISGKANVSDFALSGGVPSAQYVSSLFSSDNTSLASTIQTKIDATVGTINTALDAINGEVA